MKYLSLLLFAVLLLTNCQREAVTQDPNVLEGAYQTNAFLDPLCIAITDVNQLPRLDILKNSDGSYRLVRTTFIPQTANTTLENISAVAISGGFSLRYQNQQIGTYEDGKWFNGKKEVNSKVLKVSHTDTQGTFFYYAGVKK